MPTTFPFKPGDILFLHGNGWFDKCINFFQHIRDRDGKTSRSHTAIVLDSNGTLFETTPIITKMRDVSTAYAGSQIEVIRWNGMNDTLAKVGYEAVKDQAGCFYPYYRLPIQAVGLAPYVHFHNMECCIIAASFLKAALYPLRKNNIWAYDTESLGDELVANPDCQVVFQGSLRASGYII